MKLTLLNEIIKQELNEGKINDLANVVRFIKLNRSKWSKAYGIDDKLVDNLITSGLVSSDIFQFSALFPRNSFKIADITNGKLHQRIKASYIDKSVEMKNLKKADALAQFLKAMRSHLGDDSWISRF